MEAGTTHASGESCHAGRGQSCQGNKTRSAHPGPQGGPQARAEKAGSDTSGCGKEGCCKESPYKENRQHPEKGGCENAQASGPQHPCADAPGLLISGRRHPCRTGAGGCRRGGLPHQAGTVNRLKPVPGPERLTGNLWPVLGSRLMATRTREDRRLRLLSAVCLALPEAERTNCGAHADFRVHGKIFAYFLRNHGGDGITAACFKSRLGQHVELVKRAPDRFYLPRYIGRRGWFGVRLDQGDIDWDEVGALAAISYNLAAPKALRGAPAPLTNALTSRALIRGAPAPMRGDGNVLIAAPATPLRTASEERVESEKRLRPAAVPGAAMIKRAGALRGRR